MRPGKAAAAGRPKPPDETPPPDRQTNLTDPDFAVDAQVQSA